ncbi:hypothetical protein HDV00_012468 [Rhizophlyctis rosea]|nr:hypothetical protein HDV00_012468 [Rhizophlyctis rosea]
MNGLDTNILNVISVHSSYDSPLASLNPIQTLARGAGKAEVSSPPAPAAAGHLAAARKPGNEYYHNMAMKGVDQPIDRAICHKNDYAVCPAA